MGKTNLDIPNEKEQEVGKIFTEKWYDWQKTKKGLEGIEINEKTAKELESLKSDVKEYAERLKGLYVETYKKEPEKISEEKISDTLKNVWEQSFQLAENTENKALDAAEEQILKKAEWLKEIPLVWDFLYDYAKDILWETKKSLEPNPNEKAWDRFIRKMKIWFWSVILSLFWFKWIKEFLNTKKDLDWSGWIWNNLDWNTEKDIKEDEWSKKKQGDWEKTEEESLVIEEKAIEKVDDYKTDGKSESVKEEKEEKGNISYLLWFEAILALSWKEMEENISKEEIKKQLADVKYSKLDTFSPKWLSQDQMKQYNAVKSWLKSENTQDLLRISLSKNILENIFKRKEEKLKEIFWEDRFLEIKRETEEGEFNYKNLTIKELSILYIESVPAFWNLAMISAFEWIESFSKQALSIVWKEFTEIRDEKSFLSKPVLNFFGTNLVGIDKLKEVWENEFEKFLSETDLKEEEKKKCREDFKKVIDFKNKILEENFFASEKLWLSGNLQSKIKNEKLNYKWILALYAVTWWETDLKNLNPVNLPILVYLISEIISSGTSAIYTMEWTSYLMKFVKQVFSNKTTLTESEKKIFKIYWKKLIDLMITSHLRAMYSTLWIATDSDNLIKNWVIVWGVWLTVNILANKSIKNALSRWRLPFLSWLAKKLSWLWIWIWVFMVWTWFVAKSWKSDIELLDEKLTKAAENNDPISAIEALEDHRDSIVSTKRDLDGKIQNVKVVGYKDSIPYIVIDWKVYSIELYYDEWIVESTFWPSKMPEVNWEDISKIRFDREENNFVFGENHKISLYQLLKSRWTDEEISDENIWNFAERNVEWIAQSFGYTYGRNKNKWKITIINTGYNNNIGNFKIWLVPLEEVEKLQEQ